MKIIKIGTVQYKYEEDDESKRNKEEFTITITVIKKTF
jgi:hypothetical protein